MNETGHDLKHTRLSVKDGGKVTLGAVAEACAAAGGTRSLVFKDNFNGYVSHLISDHDFQFLKSTGPTNKHDEQLKVAAVNALKSKGGSPAFADVHGFFRQSLILRIFIQVLEMVLIIKMM